MSRNIARFLCVGVLIALIVAFGSALVMRDLQSLDVGSQADVICIRGPVDYYTVKNRLTLISVWLGGTALVVLIVSAVVFKRVWIRFLALFGAIVLGAYLATSLFDGDYPHAGDILVFCNPPVR